MGRAHKSNGIFIMVDLQVSDSTATPSQQHQHASMPSHPAICKGHLAHFRQRCGASGAMMRSAAPTSHQLFLYQLRF